MGAKRAGNENIREFADQPDGRAPCLPSTGNGTRVKFFVRPPRDFTGKLLRELRPSEKSISADFNGEFLLRSANVSFFDFYAAEVLP